MTKKELLQFLDDTVITFCEMGFMPLTVCQEPEKERDKFEERLITVETEIKNMTNKLQEVELLMEQGYSEESAMYMIYGDSGCDETNPEETDDAI